ncbi:MAG: DUF357 domain-containing protein [Candidatus Woesearchaeota archaeon]
MKITPEQERELFFYLKRELNRLSVVIKSVKLIGKSDKKFLDILNLAKCYFNDAKYFYDKKEYVKSFELLNYCWGLLDALAISKMLKVPKRFQKWFKTEF